MHKTHTLTGLLLLLAVSLSFGETYDQVVFSENFEGYTIDKPLPQKAPWKIVQQSEQDNRFAHIRSDKTGAFGTGNKNQFLQILDQSTNGAIRVVAKVFPEVGCELVRLSFDVYEPADELNGSLDVKMGAGTVDPKKSEAVNGIKFEGGRMRPRVAGYYALAQMLHVDIWFNESTNTVRYTAVNDIEWPLEPGTMAFWVNGTGVAVNQISGREVSALTAINSLRIETFSSPMQEVWFDNIEVAIPSSVDLEKRN